jgi:hypothetical protein
MGKYPGGTVAWLIILLVLWDAVGVSWWWLLLIWAVAAFLNFLRKVLPIVNAALQAELLRLERLHEEQSPMQKLAEPAWRKAQRAALHHLLTETEGKGAPH